MPCILSRTVVLPSGLLATIKGIRKFIMLGGCPECGQYAACLLKGILVFNIRIAILRPAGWPGHYRVTILSEFGICLPLLT